MNGTSWNTTTDLSSKISELSLQVIIQNIVAIVMSITIMAFEIAAGVILAKCIKIAKQVKILLLNFLLGSILFLVNIVVWSVINLASKGSMFTLTFYVRAALGGIIKTISWAAVAGVALERYVSLQNALRYVSMINNRNIILGLCIMWLVNFVLPLIFLIVSMHMTCDWDLVTCDFARMLLPLRVTFAVLIAFYQVSLTITYIKILKIVKKHLNAMTKTCKLSILQQQDDNTVNGKKTTLNNALNEKDIQSQKQKNKQKNIGHMKATRTIISVVFSFVLMHIPIFIHSLIFVFIPALQTYTWQVTFQISSYFFTNLNSSVNLYLYIWKIDECKMVFLNMFFSWNKKCREKAEKLRHSVFDIVTADVHTKRSRTNS